MNRTIIPYSLAAFLLFSGYTITEPVSANKPQTTAKSKAKSIWKVFSSPEGGFKILMPGTPKKTKQKVKTKTGEVEVNMFTVEREKEQIKYTVAYIDYPQELIDFLTNNKMVEQAIDAGKKTALKQEKGTLISEKKIDLAGYLGKEINYTKPGNKIIKHRIFLVNKRLYQVSAETTKEKQKYLTKSIRGFCDSFTLLNQNNQYSSSQE